MTPQLKRLSDHIDRKIEAQLERDLRMKQLLTDTIAWLCIVFCIFVVLSTLASTLNGTPDLFGITGGAR